MEPVSAAYLRPLVVMIALGLLAQLGNTQQPPPAHQNAAFTAADHAFRFSYPTGFQVCTRGQIKLCIDTYIPVCDEDALVCVVFPANQFKDTNFEAASFQVKEIFREKEEMTPDMCATPYPRDRTGVDR